jgi:hypothetical protein
VPLSTLSSKIACHNLVAEVIVDEITSAEERSTFCAGLIEKLRREVKAAHYISVSVDDSAAIDNTEYMSMELYYIGPDGFKKTAFLKLNPVAATTAKDLTNTLVRDHVHMLTICMFCPELAFQGRKLTWP